MPEVSTVRPDEYEKLALFLANFPGETRSMESWLKRLRAWWDCNPAFVNSFTRGWLLQEKGQIVGFLGDIPLKFQLLGKETTVFAGTTWRVLPQYRGMSMALKRRQMNEHKERLHFSTTPRPEVVRMLKLLRSRPIDRGEGTDAHSLIILNFEKPLRMRFQHAFPGTIAAKMLSPILDVYQSFRTRPVQTSIPGKVKELAKADEAFDDLWERTRTKHLNTNVRTAETVNWYCFTNHQTEKKLLAYYEGRQLFGYMVFLTDEMPGMRIFECVDLWIDPAGGEDKILAALVAKAWKVAKHGSFDRVVLPHFDCNTAALYKKLGLLKRRAWGKREFFNGPHHLMDKITAENSYFVTALGDYGL